MRSGRKKKSSTEKEGEYTKKSRDGRGTGAGRASHRRRNPVLRHWFLNLIEDPSTYRCLGNYYYYYYRPWEK